LKVMRSRDAGISWNEEKWRLRGDDLAGLSIAEARFDPWVRDRMIGVSQGGFIVFSFDSGLSWEQLIPARDQRSRYCIASHAGFGSSVDFIWATTSCGLYESSTLGDLWNQPLANTSNSPITAVQFDPDDTRRQIALAEMEPDSVLISLKSNNREIAGGTYWGGKSWEVPVGIFTRPDGGTCLASDSSSLDITLARETINPQRVEIACFDEQLKRVRSLRRLQSKGSTYANVAISLDAQQALVLGVTDRSIEGPIVAWGEPRSPLVQQDGIVAVVGLEADSPIKLMYFGGTGDDRITAGGLLGTRQAVIAGTSNSDLLPGERQAVSQTQAANGRLFLGVVNLPPDSAQK